MVLSRRELIGLILAGYLGGSKMLHGQERKRFVRLKFNLPTGHSIVRLSIYSDRGGMDITHRVQDGFLTGRLDEGIYALEVVISGRRGLGSHFIRLKVDRDIDSTINLIAFDTLYMGRAYGFTLHPNKGENTNMIMRITDKVGKELSVLDVCMYYDIVYGVIVNEARVLRAERIIGIPTLGLIGIGLTGENPIKVFGNGQIVKMNLHITDYKLNTLSEIGGVEEVVDYNYRPRPNETVYSPSNPTIAYVEKFDVNDARRIGLEIRASRTLYKGEEMSFRVVEETFKLVMGG
ncbi:MAG: hypothetical protein QXR17_09055 [Candidatus Bathyarchaeia archaeon]